VRGIRRDDASCRRSSRLRPDGTVALCRSVPERPAAHETSRSRLWPTGQGHRRVSERVALVRVKDRAQDAGRERPAWLSCRTLRDVLHEPETAREPWSRWFMLPVVASESGDIRGGTIDGVTVVSSTSSRRGSAARRMLLEGADTGDGRTDDPTPRAQRKRAVLGHPGETVHLQEPRRAVRNPR